MSMTEGFGYERALEMAFPGFMALISGQVAYNANLAVDASSTASPFPRCRKGHFVALVDPNRFFAHASPAMKPCSRDPFMKILKSEVINDNCASLASMKWPLSKAQLDHYRPLPCLQRIAGLCKARRVSQGFSQGFSGFLASHCCAPEATRHT